MEGPAPINAAWTDLWRAINDIKDKVADTSERVARTETILEEMRRKIDAIADARDKAQKALDKAEAAQQDIDQMQGAVRKLGLSFLTAIVSGAGAFLWNLLSGGGGKHG